MVRRAADHSSHQIVGSGRIEDLNLVRTVDAFAANQHALFNRRFGVARYLHVFELPKSSNEPNRSKKLYDFQSLCSMEYNDRDDG